MPIKQIVEDALHGLVVLYRQPILKLGKTASDDRISHYEILSRFNYKGEHQSPSDWIEALEEHELCYLLDRCVVEMTAQYLAGSGDDAIYSINVSGQTLNQNGKFILHVERCGLPNSVIFECTETVIIEVCNGMQSLKNSSQVRTMAVLKHLSRHFTLAIDDFGIGAFQLAHLDTIHPRFLKIDGSLAKRIPQMTAMIDISAIAQICHARNIDVVLEWVETPEQIEIARSIGIDYVQGWGVAKPEQMEVN